MNTPVRWVAWVRDMWAPKPLKWRRVRMFIGSAERLFDSPKDCMAALTARYCERDMNGNCRYSRLAFPVNESPNSTTKDTA